jgi:hypothetical protein
VSIVRDHHYQRPPFAYILLAVAFAILPRDALADTNLLTTANWVVDGTDDTGPNPSGIAILVNKHVVGAFSELVVSNNVSGMGAVAVAIIKGNGEIRLSQPPPGVFGGSFYTTGYWDCQAGFVPTMAITELNVRDKGGKTAPLVFKGKISNFISMDAKDFTMTLSRPQAAATRADVSYTLVASSDFCVDQATHVNDDGFLAARMGSNYLSADENENDQTRFIQIAARFCAAFVCVTKTKSICNDLANVHVGAFIFDSPPALGESALQLVHSQPLPRNTPTLIVNFQAPPLGQIRPQGQMSASTDPTAQNVNLWGNWSRAKPNYSANQKIGKFHFILQAVTPQPVSCDQEN